MRRATACDENNSQDAAEIVRRLHRLARDGQRLVVVLHHLAKGNGTSPRGSGDFLAGVDTFVSMKKLGDTVTITAVHHAGGETEIDFGLDFTGDGLVATRASRASASSASSSQVHLESVVQQVLAQGERSRTEVRVEVRRRIGDLGVKNEAIDGAVDRLALQGRVENVGTRSRHRWRIRVLATPSSSSTESSEPTSADTELLGPAMPAGDHTAPPGPGGSI